MSQQVEMHEEADKRLTSLSRNVPTGILALCLVARELGFHLDAARLVNEHGLPAGSVSARQIMKCASSAGLRASGLRITWDGLLKLSNALPIIVLLNDGEAMTLLSVVDSPANTCVVLLDPLSGPEASFTLGREQFSAIFSGEVVLIRRDIHSSVEDKPFGFSSIWALVLAEKTMARDIVVSALMLSLLALVPILFFRVASERVLPYHAVSTFIVICLFVVLATCFEVAFGALRRHLLLRVTTRIDVKISTDMFSRVLRLPVEYFERCPAGLTLHRMSQINRVRNFLSGQLFGTMLDAGILLFFTPIMLIISPILTCIVVVCAFVICCWIIFMLPRYRARSNATERAEAARGAFLSQSIQGIRTIKSLALEDRQCQEWDALTAKIAKLKFEEGNCSNLIQSIITPLERFLVSGTFAIGVYLALSSTEVGFTSTLFTFVLLSQRLASPLIQASQLINQYDDARIAIGAVAGLVNQPPEDGRSDKGVRNQLQGHVVFSGIVFQYKGALKPALRNVSFEIPQGTTLGVMGRSGSGKTTITRLLQRLNTDYSGLVKVDGVDVRNYDLTHFRSSLGVVLQENFLFSGTIRSNITMAKPEATFDEMVHAARLAGAEEFIERLPNGYETYIYEGSPNLSGGQRQRLAIARALITDPKILILDEATSALDAESEAIVNANIDRIAQGRTVITISHRLASLVKADAILVMEQGEVNDIGKHKELLERNEIYAHLWYTQNPHTAAPAVPRPQLTYKGPQSVA